MQNARLQLDDLLPWYPDQDDPLFQTWITGFEEFSNLASTQKEAIPRRGEPFKHQELIARFMLVYDRLYAMHRTGTGKTCASIQAAQKIKKNNANDMDYVKSKILDDEKLDEIRNALDISNLLLRSPKSNIMRVLILVKGETLEVQFKHEIICKCTGGEYETEQIKNAPTATAQRKNATNAVKHYYEITRYKTFTNSLKELNDSQIEERYSDTFIILDEIQTLRNNIEKESNKKQKREAKFKDTYDQLKRLLRVAKRIKVLILSATPMVNEPRELALIMNLLYLTGHDEMDIMANYSSDEWDLDRIEPYLRGRISYVRELDTGAIPEYIGTQIPNYYEILALAPMSEFQANSYRAIGQNSFYTKAREASIFVFPDSGMTTASLKRYIEATPKVVVDVIKEGNNRTREESRLQTLDEAKDEVVRGDGPYTPTQEFLSYIRHREPVGGKSLSLLSRKYQNIIDICSQAINKSCFVFADFVTGPGSIALAMCFESQGFDRFFETAPVFVKSDNENIILPSYCESEDHENLRLRSDFVPKTRYALLTGNTSQQMAQNILKTFNSYENRHGELIRVLIGSVKIREGLNLSNVQVIQLVGGGWNQAVTYQAISRGIRSTSHVYLIYEIQDKIIEISVNTIYLTSLDIINIENIRTDPSTISLKNSIVDIYTKIRETYVRMAGHSKLSLRNIDREKIKVNLREIVKLINSYLNIIESENKSLYQREYDSLKFNFMGINCFKPIDNASANQIKNIGNGLLKLVRNIKDINMVFKDEDQASIDTINQIVALLNTGGQDQASSQRLANLLRDKIKNILQLSEDYLQSLTKSQISENQQNYTKSMTILEGYQSPDDATISIQVYKHASVFDIRNSEGVLDIEVRHGENGLESGPALNTVDIKFYQDSERKDRKNRKVERYMKQIAIDGQIHKNRNIRDDPSLNNTPVCDYQNCEYNFYDPSPKTIYRYRSEAIGWQKIYSRAVIKSGSIHVYDGFNWTPLALDNANIGALTDRQQPNIYQSNSLKELDNMNITLLPGDLLIGGGELAIDYTNYDNIYAKEDIERTTEEIIKKLQENTRITYPVLFKEIPDSLPTTKPRYILESLVDIIDNKKTVRNRYGVINYVNEENGSIFSQPEYPDMPFYKPNQIGLDYYTKHFHGIESMSLEDILNEEDAQSQQDILRRFTYMPKDMKFHQALNELNTVSRATLLEEAIDSYIYNEIDNNQALAQTVSIILNKFGNLFYYIQNPLNGQEKYRVVNSQRGVIGRGRRPNPNKKIKIQLFDQEKDSDGINWVNYLTHNGIKYYLTTITNTVNNKPTPGTYYKEVNDNTKYIVNGPIQDQNGTAVIIHNIYTMNESTTKANMAKRLTRANGRLRIFSIADRKWRDIQKSETVVYSAITQLEITKKFDIFNNIPVYGLYTPDNVFRLVRSLPGQNIHDSLVRICTTLKNYELAWAIINLDIDPDIEFEPLTSQETPQIIDRYLYDNLQGKVVMGNPIDVSTLNPKEKHIYYRIIRGSIKIGDLCNKIQTIIQRKGYVIYF